MLKKMYNILWHNPFANWFLVGLIIIDVLGSIYGYYWYRHQLAATPFKWWLFIPDSPLSTTLTAIALILILLNKRYSLFEWIAFTAIIKYGIWAVVIISHFGLTGGYIEPEIWMLWLSHLGMAAQGFIFLRHVRVTAWEIGLGALWMLFNDFLDYGLGLHPYLYASYQWQTALYTALGLTVFLSLCKIGNFKKRKTS